MEVKVYLTSHFEESCPQDKLARLTQDFKEYKNTGVRPSDFGRDASYDRPFTVKNAELMHIHIRDQSSRSWHLRSLQFDMKSNTALIYCHGFIDKNKYLLLGFLDSAHEAYSNNPQYLLSLAVIAERFRSRF